MMERMALEGFVNVHGEQRRHVEASYPHVADNGNAEVRIVVLELLVEHGFMLLGAA